MIARLSTIALCTAIAIAPTFAKEKPAPAPEPVACEGVFGPQSSEALLIETFGAENVVTGEVAGAEGMEMLATTVFPNDPEKTMQFGWWNDQDRKELSYVDLAPSQVAPGGVRIGMTVPEVVALNGEGFGIGGFWWDYGGYANIETGKLTDLPGGCYLSLRFSPAEEYSSAIDITPVAGEVMVPSDEGLLEVLDVRVRVLNLSYPGPEGDE